MLYFCLLNLSVLSQGTWLTHLPGDGITTSISNELPLNKVQFQIKHIVLAWDCQDHLSIEKAISIYVYSLRNPVLCDFPQMLYKGTEIDSAFWSPKCNAVKCNRPRSTPASHLSTQILIQTVALLNFLI